MRPKVHRPLAYGSLTFGLSKPPLGLRPKGVSFGQEMGPFPLQMTANAVISCANVHELCTFPAFSFTKEIIYSFVKEMYHLTARAVKLVTIYLAARGN